MAFIIQLTDGSDTIDFMTDDFQVEDGGLQITSPEEDLTWSDPTEQGGANLVSSRYGNRTVTVTFQVAGTDRSVLRSGINRISAMLKAATQHSLGTSSTRVTFKYAWDDMTSVDNFEVLTGKLTLPDDVLSVEKLHSRWSGNLLALAGCTLELTVSPTAYGLSPSTDSLLELPLTNRNGTGVLGGLRIGPFTDLTAKGNMGTYFVDNYVEIPGSAIQGDSPAKVRIEITAVEGAGGVDKILVGAHEPSSAPLFFHCENSAFEFSGGGAFYSNSYSLGGSYWRRTNIDKSSVDTIFRLKLTNVAQYRSRNYRALICTGMFPWFYETKTPMRLVVQAANSVQLSQGPIVEQYFSSSGRAMYQDLGIVQLPPYSPKLPTPSDVYLSLMMQGAGYFNNYNMTVNSLILIPTDNGYREMSFVYPLEKFYAVNPIVVDDGWNDISYITAAGGTALQAVNARFAPITLTPGKTQRIYFTFMGHQYAPGNSDNFRVRVFYSPSYMGAV